MNAKEIKKKIKWYTMCKVVISVALIVLVVCFCAGMLFHNNPVAIITYLLMILVLVAGYLFPVNKPLSKEPMVQDYRGILEYLASIPDNIGKYVYYDGLVMIKQSLNYIAYYQVDKQDTYLKKGIYYLQAKFLSTDKKKFIPMIFFDRVYVRGICSELLQQMEKKEFNIASLEAIQCTESPKIKKHIHITHQSVCNVLLACIVIFKIVVTIDKCLYDLINEVVIMRLIYNIGADVIAVALAYASKFQNKRM